MWSMMLWACTTSEVDTGFELDLENPVVDTALEEESDSEMIDSGAEDSSVETLNLIGDWEDVFGDRHVVTEESWTNPTGVFHIQEFSNEDRRLITLNDANNQFNAGKFSVFEWLEFEGQKFLCQSGLEASSAEEAQGITADRSDLEGGCRGQGWKRFRQRIPISGQYLDPNSLPVQINSFRWVWGMGTFHVVDFYYEEFRVMARNDQNNPVLPNLWSQIAWIQNSEGTWICLVEEGAETLESASSVDVDMETPLQGCNGEAWTQLTKLSE